MATLHSRRDPSFDGAAWRAIVDLAIGVTTDSAAGRETGGQLARRMAEAILALGEPADLRCRERGSFVGRAEEEARRFRRRRRA
jgi:hypothetical protein